MILAAIALLGIVSVPMIAGAPLRRFAIPAAARWSAGGCAIALLVMGGHVLGAGEAQTMAIAGAFVAGAGAIGLARPSTVPAITRREVMLAGLMAAPLLAGAIQAFWTPVRMWDAVVIWFAKARGVLDWTPAARMPFAPYPELGAVAWALPLRLSGAWEPASRLVFTGFYAAWVLSLRELLPRPLPRFALVMVPVIVLAMFDARFATSGYQDPVLASVGGTAFILLVRHIEAGRPADAAVGLFLAGAMATIKLEGIVCGLAIGGGWIWALTRERGWHARLRALTIPIAIYAALLAFWPAASAINHISIMAGQAPAFETARISDLVHRAPRLVPIAQAFFTIGPTFYLPFAAALVAGAAAAHRIPSVRRRLGFAGIVAALHTSWIIVTFMLTNADLAWHLRTAFNRLLSQQLGIWTAAIVVSVTALLGANAPELRPRSSGSPKRSDPVRTTDAAPAGVL